MSESTSDDTEPSILAHNTTWLSRGLWVRVLIYLVGGHVFAAFLFLLFELGARHSH